nr:(Fe-S)-binding protein [Candidatus Njordarchaeota archaeon]
MSLDEVKDWLHRCYRCGNCKLFWGIFAPSCPSGEYFHFESYFPSGRIWIGKALHNEEIKWSPSITKKIFACTLCGACSTSCKVDMKDHSADILEALRATAVAEGFGPMGEQKRFTQSIEKQHNPYNESHDKRPSWLDSSGVAARSDKPTVLYFAGCTSSYRRPEIASATAKILGKAGVKFIVLDDEWCCGSPLLRTGQRDAAKKQAEHNVELINKSGVATVVTSCAGCYRAFVKDYADKLGLQLEPEILHITQFLERLLNDRAIESPSAIKGLKVTYHDPCHLGRHCTVYNPPRNVMKATGVEVVEMGRNRENAWCCGSGGGVKSAFNDMAVKTAALRMVEAEQTGVETLVSACPFCKHNLLDGAKEAKSRIRVIDIVELLAQ